MTIRPATESERQAVLDLERCAFGDPKGPEIADLVRDLLTDPTAAPSLSLIAIENNRAVGHILFTKARITGCEAPPTAALLAPLAIVPEVQGRGIGGQLIRDGLGRLSDAGVALVFVLGHPSYYPRHGFRPAGALGLDAPYPIPEEHAAAWMVQELRPGVLGRVRGTVACAAALDRPEHWRE